MGLSHVLLTFHLRAKAKSHQNLPLLLTPAVTVYYGILISRLFFSHANINSVPFYSGVNIGYPILKKPRKQSNHQAYLFPQGPPIVVPDGC